MRIALTIIVTLVAIVALGEAYIDQAVFDQFLKQEQTGEKTVLDGKANLIEDIKLHPDNRFQHKTYCGQLITIITNVRINIETFRETYHSVIGSGQSSAVADAINRCNEILTDLNELNKTI